MKYFPNAHTLVLLALLLLGHGRVSAQGQFRYAYGGLANESARAGAAFGREFFYSLGSSESAGPKRVALLKTDSLGKLLAIKEYAAGSSQEGYGMVCKGRFLYMSGEATVGGINMLFLAKADLDGNLVWQRFFSQPATVNAFSPFGLAATADGGFALCGFNNGNRLFLLKVDSLGTLQWAKTRDDLSQAHGVTSARNGDILLCGTVDNELLVSRFALDGALVWSTMMGGSGLDLGAALAELANGSILVTGYRFDGERDFAMTKLTSAGRLLWTRTYHHAQDINHGITLDLDGNLILTGYSFSGNPGEVDYSIVKTDTAGTVLWAELIAGAMADRPPNASGPHLVPLGDQEYMAFGQSASAGGGGAGDDLILFRFRPGNSLGCFSPAYSPVASPHAFSTADTAGAYSNAAGFVQNPAAFFTVGSAGMCKRVACEPGTPLYDNLGPDITMNCGDSVRLRAGNPGSEFRWNTGEATQTILVREAGRYSVLVTSLCGIFRDTINVRVNPLDVTARLSDTAACSGSAITLTASGPSPFSATWSGDGQIDNPAALTTPATVTNSTPGPQVQRFILVARAGTCPPKSDTLTLRVYPAPARPGLDSSGRLVFCQGDSVRLFARPPSDTIVWNTGLRDSVLTVRQSGDYYALAVNRFGCRSAHSDTLSVAVNSPPSVPVITAQGPTTFCQGDSVWLVAVSFADSLIWNTGVVNDSLLVTAPGSYYAVATYRAGCRSDTSPHVRVTVHPVPATPAISASGPLALCEGDSVVLYAIASTADTLIWSTGHRGDSLVVRTAGQYSVRTLSTQGCTGGLSGPVQVTVKRKPLLATFGDTLLCGQDSTVIRMQTGLTTDLEADWLDEDGAEVRTGFTLRYRAENREETEALKVFIARVRYIGTNCASYDTVRIRIHPNPRAAAGPDTALCAGQSAVLGRDAGPTHLFSYLWQPAFFLDHDFVPMPTVRNDTAAGQILQYVLRKRNLATGCEGRDTVVVRFQDLHGGDFAGPDVEVCSGQQVLIGQPAAGIPEMYVRWSPGNWLSDSLSPVPVVAPVLDSAATRAQTIIYKAFQYGWSSPCPAAVDSVLVTVHPLYELRPDGTPYCEEAPLVIPNIITPDGDRRNDAFHIRKLEFYPQNRLTVYNRWGTQVYAASPYRNTWNAHEAGMYFYRLEVTGGRRFTGWVEVVR